MSNTGLQVYRFHWRGGVEVLRQSYEVRVVQHWVARPSSRSVWASIDITTQFHYTDDYQKVSKYKVWSADKERRWVWSYAMRKVSVGVLLDLLGTVCALQTRFRIWNLTMQFNSRSVVFHYYHSVFCNYLQTSHFAASHDMSRVCHKSDYLANSLVLAAVCCDSLLHSGPDLIGSVYSRHKRHRFY